MVKCYLKWLWHAHVCMYACMHACIHSCGIEYYNGSGAKYCMFSGRLGNTIVVSGGRS